MIRSLLKFSLLLFWLLIPLGCAAIIIPASEGEVMSGRKITSENIEFIKQGITSRNEVIQKLGRPYMDFEDLQTIAYFWEVLGYYMPWIALGYYGGGGWVEKIGKTYALLIAFDKDDYVSKFEIKALWPLDTIRGHAIKWMERENFDVPQPTNEFVASEIPKGLSIIYIYRPGGWRDVSQLFKQPTVSIDGEVVAELHQGGYVAKVLKPGLHNVSVFLKSKERPDRMFSFDTLQDTAYYLELCISFVALGPKLTIRSTEDAMPVLKELKPTW